MSVKEHISLLNFHLFFQREKFFGERTTRNLVNFAMKYVSGQVHTIWESSFKSVVTEQDDLPWLITFCGDGGGKKEQILLSMQSYNSGV